MCICILYTQNKTLIGSHSTSNQCVCLLVYDHSPKKESLSTDELIRYRTGQNEIVQRVFYVILWIGVHAFSKVYPNGSNDNNRKMCAVLWVCCVYGRK